MPYSPASSAPILGNSGKTRAVLHVSRCPVGDADELVWRIDVSVLKGIGQRRLHNGRTGHGGKVSGGINLHNADAATDFGRCSGAGYATDIGERFVKDSITAVASALVLDAEKGL